MKKTLESQDREFLDRLQRLGSGTVQEICKELGVTATAVRHRLVRLQSLGFVGRDLVREGRGRPHHVYRVTSAGQRELGDNYGDLALVLWRELQSIPDEVIRAKVEARIRDAMVSQYGHEVNSPQLRDRFQQLGEVLAKRGYDVEVDQSSTLPVLRENNCPYQELADGDRGICEMEEEVFEKVLGIPLRLSQCFLDGHSCCEFEPAEKVPQHVNDPADSR
jgi:predicted ArsR family transcriptional regulator